MSRTQKGGVATGNHFWWNDWQLTLLLGIVTMMAYWPSLHGGFIFDDDVHISQNSTLLSLHGLKQIWFEPGATCQYYPLTFTAFWIGHHLWGLNTFGYHLSNVLVHLATAILFWQLLKRLQVPGAFLAGIIFALHPVNVMSVAWMTELKNTLSAALAIGACWAYVRWAGLGVYVTPGNSENPSALRHRRGFYVLSLILFLLAMFAKTSVSLVPVTLLLVVWWQRDRLRWRDGLALLPFLLIVMAVGRMTLSIEDPTHAMDRNYHLGFLERMLISGRSFWFYLGKLIFPHPLIFIYERWKIDPASGWQYLFPVATLAFLIGLWLARGKIGRGPLVAALHFYLGTSFLVLIMTLTMARHTFVSDHWQYLGSMSIIALGAAGIATVLQRRGPQGRVLGRVAGGCLLLTLGGLAWRQSSLYANPQTLYLATIAGNPGCGAAHNNLGNILLQNGRVDEAIVHFEKAVELQPDMADPRDSLGTALLEKGRVDEAIAQFQSALEIQPDYALTYYDLGSAFLRQGRLDEAISSFQKALELKPNDAQIHNNLGLALFQNGRVDDAIIHYQKALELWPNNDVIQDNLNRALFQKSQEDKLANSLQKPLESSPNDALVHISLGLALLQKGQADEAIVHFQKALEIQPDNGDAWCNLGVALLQKGRLNEAITRFQEGVKVQPNNANLLNNLAWIMATCPDASLRDGARAVEMAEQADRLSGGKNPLFLGTLGAAYAEAGRFPEAAATAQRALQAATEQTNLTEISVVKTQIGLFQSGLPFRDVSLTNFTAPATFPLPK